MSNTINYTPTVIFAVCLLWSLFVIIDKLLLMFFLVIPCILVQLQFFSIQLLQLIQKTYKKHWSKPYNYLFLRQKFNDTFSFLSSYLQIPTFTPILTPSSYARNLILRQNCYIQSCTHVIGAKKHRQCGIAPTLTVSLYYNYICLSGIVLLSASQLTYAMCIQYLKLLSYTHYAYFLIYNALPS